MAGLIVSGLVGNAPSRFVILPERCGADSRCSEASGCFPGQAKARLAGSGGASWQSEVPVPGSSCDQRCLALPPLVVQLALRNTCLHCSWSHASVEFDGWFGLSVERRGSRS